MKKFFIALNLILFTLSPLFGQSFRECPKMMKADSLNGASQRISWDIWFNESSDSSKAIYNYGSIDLEIYPLMTEVDSTDTLVIDVYALKLKRLNGNSFTTVFATDSTRITATLTVDSLLHSYPLETYFGSDMLLIDGVRVKIKNAGTDADSSLIQGNCKTYYETPWKLF